MSIFAWFSPPDMLVVAVIVLLLFGNRLPSVMRSLGQGVTEFKKGLEGVPDDSSKTSDPPKKLDDQPAKS
jgi:sec-independent protein translocase protein TatA